MASQAPHTMRALVLAKYSSPSEYNIATVPTPVISQPDEILIRVHAASVNPVDCKMATGMTKMMKKDTFPYKMGYDLAGVVVASGSAVSFKPGDEVFSRVPEAYRGTIAEYALSTASTTARKPKSLSFSEAASIPLAALTAFQSLQEGDKVLEGGLKGKTIYIPAGLSGTGLFGVQIAKNIFGASKVITTLSTGKIPMIKEMMGVNTPDQIIDYTKDDAIKCIGPKTVDFMFDTMGGTLGSLSVMKKGGMIISVSTVPSGSAVKQRFPDTPTWMVYILNIVNFFFTRLASWRDVKYESFFMHADGGDLEKIGQWVEEGKIKLIIGNKVKMSDIVGLRKGCQQILDGKGGVGKFVVDID